MTGNTRGCNLCKLEVNGTSKAKAEMISAIVQQDATFCNVQIPISIMNLGRFPPNKKQNAQGLQACNMHLSDRV